MDKTTLHFGETLTRYGADKLLRSRGRVLLGFSGGADSSCLLVLLREWCAENGVRLEAAHVNHGIRGEEADRDEEFCRERCRELGIPLEVKRIDVPALAAERGTGIEETARDVRYAFFDELTSADGAPIATAHNATDNLETVLFRLLRGTGLRGLCGIPPIRDGRLIRPLLRDSAEDIRRYCAENSVPYVEDRTNGEADCARNRIRLNVLPLFREIFPSPEEAAARMTELLREDEDFLESAARESVPEGAVSLDRETFASLPPAVGTRVLRILSVNAGGRTPEAAHIREILRFSSSPLSRSVSLPGGIRCVSDREGVRMEREERRERKQSDGGTEEEDPVVISPDRPVQILRDDGFCRVSCVIGSPPPGGFPAADAEGRTEENIYKSSISVSLCFDKMCKACRIRTRRPGDTYVFGGMRRRVKTLFSDRKLPERIRAALPVFEDGDGIVWIPGFPPRDGLRFEGEGLRITLVCEFPDSVGSYLQRRD